MKTTRWILAELGETIGGLVFIGSLFFMSDEKRRGSAGWILVLCLSIVIVALLFWRLMKRLRKQPPES